MLCVKVNSNTIELTPCYWVLDLFCVILWLEGHKKAKFVWRHFWMTLPGSRSVCQKSFHGLGKEMPSSDLSVPWVWFFWDGQRREGVSQFHLVWEQSIAASICPTFLSSSAERERTNYSSLDYNIWHSFCSFSYSRTYQWESQLSIYDVIVDQKSSSREGKL